MADHRAEQIMDAFVAAIGNLTTTSTNVFRDRVEAIDPSITAALSVYQGEDYPLDTSDQNWFTVDHVLEIMIEIQIKQAYGTPISQTLNQIRKEIAVAIQAAPQLGLSFVIDTVEGAGRRPRIDFSEKSTALQAYEWRVKYQRSRTDPSA